MFIVIIARHQCRHHSGLNRCGGIHRALGMGMHVLRMRYACVTHACVMHVAHMRMLVFSMCYLLVYCHPSYCMLSDHVDFTMTAGWIVACFALA